MLYFSKWKIVAILLTVFAGIVFALPNVLSEKQANSLPTWLPHYQMTLGLDLKGGAHLLMQVDEEKLIEERLDALRDDVRVKLREAGVRGRARTVGDRAVEVTLRDPTPANFEAMNTAMQELLQPTLTGVLDGFGVVEIRESQPSENVIRYALTDEGVENRITRAITQSISVFGDRLDAFGTTEPIIQREGANRVLVQYPGLEASEIPRLKDLLNTEAKLSFHPVSNAASPDELLNSGRTPPAGTRILFEDTDPPIPYLIRTRATVQGDELTEASSGFDQRTGEPLVFFRFNASGSQKFARFTSENVGQPFAIVLDDIVLSAPIINEPIIGGSGQISGDFTPQTANDLAVLLSAGALPASFEFVEERTVGPGLGRDSIEAGFNASIVGAVLVLIFMIVSYGFLGIIANLALIANISMLIALLSVLGATLTLPGIAGIVLTMGMAVDANVLIYERIREERRAGRNLIQSFDAGFKQAFTTILDANITTLIAAIILFYLGSGPVRGFAVTLAIGIVTTVFTAYTFTRLMVSLWVKYRRPTELPSRLFGLLPESTTIGFMKHRRFSFPFSGVSVVASILLFFIVSLNYGIDFKGGTLFEVRPLAQAQITEPQNDIRTKLSELNVGEVQVQEFGTQIDPETNQPVQDILVRIESQGLGDSAEQSAESLVRATLEDAYDFRRVEVVGPTVSNELRIAGTISVIAALLAIMAYIWIRFEWQFALGAVAATLHDVILTIGIFSILQLEFALPTIAALLTIVGYSLNDTVVVYDRIRENLRKYKKKPVADVIDMSINQMLSRTILTSVTTLLALFSLYFLGGEVLASFTFAMIFGVFVGTYSSIFVAAPLLILFKLRPGQVVGGSEKDNIDAEKQATANTLPVQLPE
ncbi:MAG: protein translocase subunit SecD [Pseudomonadota bacterium]